jgi:F420-non-reducing hydrogenase iron-sulfur subunit
MCIGRINQALILQAFEYGADGVILLHCKEEDCRYGTGPEIGQTNIQRVRNLLHLLGIGQKRLIERSFAPTEQDLLMESLWEFHRLIQKMGSNPAKPRQERVAL